MTVQLVPELLDGAAELQPGMGALPGQILKDFRVAGTTSSRPGSGGMHSLLHAPAVGALSIEQCS